MKNRHKYPEEWFDIIRPEILKRDNYKCQDCKLRHKSIGYYDAKGEFIECDHFMQLWAIEHGLKIQKISLQIAHLDQNPSNNTYENLECKCPKCHLRFDAKYNAIKRLQRKRR